jgi:RNA recognition motif-containing protein
VSVDGLSGEIAQAISNLPVADSHPAFEAVTKLGSSMDNNCRLFVGNLSFQTLEGDLQNHFSAAGTVVNVNLMLDKFTGRSRGFAFVEFGSPEEAQKAAEMFNGQELGGRALTVNIARPREERPPGGGGGFRGSGSAGGFRGGGGGGYRGDRGGGDRGGGGGGGGWRGDRGGGDRGGDRGGWRGERGSGRGGDQWAGDGGDRY